jgi:hypothetical protein
MNFKSYENLKVIMFKLNNQISTTKFFLVNRFSMKIIINVITLHNIHEKHSSKRIKRKILYNYPCDSLLKRREKTRKNKERNDFDNTKYLVKTFIY